MSNDWYLEMQKPKKEQMTMRKFCQRPGRKDKMGNNIYMTEQAHKDTCDINKIIERFDRDGIISHVSKFEGKFGDLSGADFKEMMDQVTNAQSLFDELPVNIRNRFENSPEKLLTFMDEPGNRQEAIELGMIRESWSEAVDGLGEHVIRNDEGEVTAESPAKEPVKK